VAHFTPAKTSPEEIEKFASYVLTQITTTMMPGNLDQFNILFDCRSIGRANVEVAAAKSMVKVLTMFVERVHRIYLIESGYIMWGFWKMFKVFVPTRTQDKVAFVTIA